MDYKEKLKELGLNDKGAAIYIAGLELGEFTISSISHKTGIKRPTCYLAMDELIKKGLVVLIPRGRKSLYRSAPPETILENISKKMGLANLIIPHLINIQAKEKTTPTIHFYRGRVGIETVYNDIFKSKPGTILYSISSIDQITKVVGREFFDAWVKKRVKKNIQSMIVMPEKDRDTSGFLVTDPKDLREYRYLPEPFKVKTTMGVYGDKVAFFSSTKDDFSFIITSEEFAQTIKDFFDYFWSMGKM